MNHANPQQDSKQRNKIDTVSKPVSIKQTDSVKAVLRPKLKIGAPNDKYEWEADRVADQVMRMPEPRSTSLPSTSSQVNNTTSYKAKIQRACTSCAEGKDLLQTKTNGNVNPEMTPAISSSIQSLQGGGKPLSRSERNFFEPRFGANFSGVRVHTDARAAGLAQSVDARAFTHGNNVVFGAGQYRPRNVLGQRLLAHELAHVMQQQPFDKQLNVIRRFPINITQGPNPGQFTRANYNLRYKVFEQGVRQPIVSEVFSRRGQRVDIRLHRGKSYVVQIVGNVRVTTPERLINQDDIRIDWPVRVDSRGNLSRSPTSLDITPQQQQTHWVLEVRSREGGSEAMHNLGMELSLRDTQIINRSEGSSSGTAITRGGEISVEPAGIGVASNESETWSEEHSIGTEIAGERPIQRRFGLWIDLTARNQVLPSGTISWRREADITVRERQRQQIRAYFNALPSSVGSQLITGERTLYIHGHATPTGTEEANLERYSLGRAQNVENFIRNHVLGTRAQISIRGTGSIEPFGRVVEISIDRPL